MSTLVDFGSQQRREVGSLYVYLREKWADAWDLYADLHCPEATWCLSPSMPTATLEWAYGWVKGLAQRQVSVVQKLDVNGWYVKVVMETDTLAGEQYTWYGVIEEIEDDHRGIVTAGGLSIANGWQTLHCYGLERLLDKEYLAESWVDVDRAAPIAVQLPIVFNRGGRPNKNDWLTQPLLGNVFEGRKLTPGGTNRPTAQWWSTWDICDYLVRWMSPKDSFRTRNKRIPYVLVNDAMYLPLLDRPVVEQEGNTVLSLLNRLIDRRRLRSFRTTVDETKTPSEVQLVVNAWNKDEIDPGIDDVDILLPNYDVVSLKYDRNESTTSTLRKTKVNRYDRIVCRGARRTSTATFFVDATLLAIAWTAAEETAYEAAASGEAGYAGWDVLKKKQRNLEVRSSDELSAVYSWFQLPYEWGQTVLAPDSANSQAAFIDSSGIAVPQDIHEVFFQPSLPLYEHVDYSGSVIADDTAADPPVFVYRKPLVVFKVPTDARYVAGDAIATLAESTCDPVGDGKNWRWSAVVQVQPDSRVLEVPVSGEPQHVIAKTDFTPLAGDRDVGDFDYQSKEMLITATLLDNRYAEGKYPPDGTLDGTLIDEQFGYVIYAGDAYRQDYVVPDTVVDVDTAGALVKSNGGYVRDDTDLLAALARVAYEWWHQERVVLALQTTQLTSKIQVGYLIDTIGDSTVTANVPGLGVIVNEHYEAVNTVVSELRISWPRLEGNQRGMPRMQFVTGAGELDPMTLAPPRQKTVSRAQARRMHR